MAVDYIKKALEINAADPSAHNAQAEHFIYIENQYFLGSSHCWAEDKHAGATHLVPIEIALKIVQKINAGERFMAYIMVPLFPEGGWAAPCAPGRAALHHAALCCAAMCCALL